MAAGRYGSAQSGASRAEVPATAAAATPSSCRVDRPILSTSTVGRISWKPLVAPSMVSARAANGSATASTRSALARSAGRTGSASRPATRSLASGYTNAIRTAAPSTDEIATGMTVARMMAGIRRSACRALRRAMK